jgi:hypothetical protein
MQSLAEKEKNLQESLSRQSLMEQKLSTINQMEYQQKLENERLLKVYQINFLTFKLI